MNAYQTEDNASRIARADHVVNLAHRLQGGDCEDALTDLLCDLMHWSENTGARFWDALEAARLHYVAESENP